MRRSIACSSMLVWSLAAAHAAAAQQQQQQRFHYPAPPPSAVRVMANVPFATVDTIALAMDIYRPTIARAASPALILFRGYDPRRGRERPTNEWLRGWARIAAANGIVGIVPDLRGNAGVEDLRRLLSHLAERGAQYGVDAERLAILAASANVSTVLPAVQDSAQSAIKAAVLYYGTARVEHFRTDLPLLLVRAGRDHAETNAAIASLASLAIAQNAPVTLLNHHTGRHGFELLDDDVATHQVIEQTLEFVTRATAPAYQRLLRERRLDAAAEGYLGTGRFHEASRAMAELLKQRPADGLLRFHYAAALLGDGQFAAACTEYRSFSPPSFAAIIPGARACLQAGSVDSTVVWLGRMPKGWVQPDAFRADSVFAPLWSRPDFQALFRQ